MIGALKGKWWSVFCLTNLWQRTGLHSQLKISCWLEEGLSLSVTGIKLHKNLIRGVSLEKEGTQDLEILQCRLSAAFAYLVSVAHSALQTDTYALYILKKPLCSQNSVSPMVQRASCWQVALFMVYWSHLHRGGPGKRGGENRERESSISPILVFFS